MNKIINMNITVKDLFRKWLEITKPFHSLNKQQQDILGLFLYYHFKLQDQITNNKILWKMVFDYETKHKIKEELGIKDQAIQNAMTFFKKNNVIEDGKITPVFIPTIEKKNNNFKIVFNFNIIHE